MNTYAKYCPNVFLAKCEEKHEKGDIIEVTTKYGKENECEVHNLIFEKNGFYYYSITRTDGWNAQERAKAKAERYANAAANASAKADHYFERSMKDHDWLSLGEPIHVGHHSEKRHRKALDDAWNNTGKMVEQMRKSEAFSDKAEAWESHANDINLSMPESVEYYKNMAEKTAKYHADMKAGIIPRSHSYSLTYAKKNANEAAKNYEIAKKLWA